MARRTPRWALVGVPAVLVLGVAGFWLWNSTRTPAFTERDVIVVADFANSTGDAVFDDALKQAVSVQLQQTAFVTLLADRQVQSTLALMQRKPEEPVDRRRRARAVPARGRARHRRRIDRAARDRPTSSRSACTTARPGAAIAQEQTQADSKEGVLKAVGTSVTALRKRLGESLASIQKNDVPAEATTTSLEALRAYGLGVASARDEGGRRGDSVLPAGDREGSELRAGAREAQRRALESRPPRRRRRRKRRRPTTLRDTVSEYERLYILWSYYARTGDDAKAEGDARGADDDVPARLRGEEQLGIY